EVERVDQRVVVLRRDAQAFEDPEPVEIGEQLLAPDDDAARGTVLRDALREGFGRRGARGLLPERLVTPSKLVVEDRVITNAVQLRADGRVVARDVRRVELPVRKMIEKVEHGV